MAHSDRVDTVVEPAHASPGRFAAARGMRDWVIVHRIKSLLIGAVLLSIAMTALRWAVFAGAKAHIEQAVTLQMALDALDRRALVEAQELARRLRDEGQIAANELGGPAFVLGAALALETDARWEKDKAPWYLLASRHLEEARDRGFPAGRAGEGLFELGRCLYQSGRFAASRSVLGEALSAGPDYQSRIHDMLAGAYLSDANPNYEKALEHNREYLADTSLAEEARHEAVLQRSQILLGLARIDECRKALAAIPPAAANYADALVVESRLLMCEARQLETDPAAAEAGQASPQAVAKYHEAIERLREAQTRDTLGNQATRKSMYLIGVCYSNLGELRAAQDQLARTTGLYHDTPENLAGSFELGEVLRLLGLHAEAIAAYQGALTAAGQPSRYSNPWISLDELRRRTFEVYEFYAKVGEFKHALELLGSFQPLFSQDRTVELEARTHRLWGESLAREAERVPEHASRPLRREASAHFRKAGYTYAHLAKLRSAAREYPDAVWHSADNLLEGHDYRSAIRMLKEYLKNELRQNRPQALVGLGKASLAIGNLDQSIKAFHECLEFHGRDAAVYDARFWCSKAYLEKGDALEAEKLLRENLLGEGLTPASREWRDSLFLLGSLLHREGRHDEAITKLEEAVARYPDIPQAIEAMYLIAESHREAAKEPEQRLKNATIESVRVAQSKEFKRLLEEAIKYYTLVQKTLHGREEAGPLGALESATLRNCYFSIGAVLFDLGLYQEAIKAYSDASTRYQNEPLVLEAYIQIADCHRRLNKPVEARGTLAQAKVVWKRLPDDEPFVRTTNFTRDEWIDRLDQLSSW